MAGPPPVSRPAATPTATGSTKAVNPFLAQDPRQKARRLARALVSDMIVYQPDKRQKALKEGNLKQAFQEEIKKSWEEYAQQVGEDLAKSTPFFTDALNEILAGGQKVF
jgi:NAD dependent epimerase/dehydratase family enzyme